MPAAENVKLLIKAATGYEVPTGDEVLLSYLLGNETQAILNNINADELPDGLGCVAEELAAGMYLNIRKDTVLGNEGLDVVTSVKEGDTTVNLGGSTPEERLVALIGVLRRERDLSCYRKLKW